MRALIGAVLAVLLVVACGGGGAPQIQGSPGVTSGTRPAATASGNPYGY